MAAQVTSLSLAVDSSQVRTAAGDLSKMASAGTQSATAANVLQGALDRTQAAAGQVGRTLNTATTASQAAAGAMAKQTTAANAMSQALGMTAHQQQQLAFQLNDFAVQVASGQSPFTALIQQGSQLSGTFGGIGGAIRAVLSVFTVARVAIGGTALALGSFALAAYQGHEQSLQLTRDLGNTGNAAGLTAGQFNALTAAVATSSRTGLGDTRDTLQALVASGRFAGEALRTTGLAVQQLSKATGQSSEDIVQQFVSLSGNVAKGAEELNRQYHFLTAAQLDYIDTLEKQGDGQRAIEVTMAALSGRLGHSTQQVGLLEAAWRKAKGAIDGFIDSARAVGRDESTQDRLRNVEAQIAERQQRGPLNSLTTAAYEKGLALLMQQRGALQEIDRLERRSAEASAREAALQQAAIQFGKLKEQTLSKQVRLQQELTNANALADRAQASPDDRSAVLAGIREKYGSLDTDVNALRKAQLDADLAEIKRQLDARNQAYRNADAVFNAQRQAGLVDDRAFYAERRNQLQRSADAEVDALDAEIDRLRAQKLEGKDAAKAQIENGQKIADRLAAITRLRADTATQQQVLDIEERAAMQRRAGDYLQGRIAAQQYFEAVQRGNALELQLVAASDRERSAAQGRAHIDERALAQRNELEATKQLLELQGRFGADDQQRYDERLAVITDHQRRALAQWDAHYEALQDAEGQWVNGAARAMGNYVDAAKDVARQAEDLFSGAFRGIEDTLATLVTSGKLDFKSLANSIIADIARMQARAALLNGMKSGGLLSSLFGLFAGAAGGGVGSPGNAGAGDYKAYYDGLVAPMSAGPSLKTLNAPPSMQRAAAAAARPREAAPVTAAPTTTNVYQVQSGITRNELLATLQTFATGLQKQTEKRLRAAGV